MQFRAFKIGLYSFAYSTAVCCRLYNLLLAGVYKYSFGSKHATGSEQQMTEVL